MSIINPTHDQRLPKLLNKRITFVNIIFPYKALLYLFREIGPCGNIGVISGTFLSAEDYSQKQKGGYCMSSPNSRTPKWPIQKSSTKPRRSRIRGVLKIGQRMLNGNQPQPSIDRYASAAAFSNVGAVQSSC